MKSLTLDRRQFDPDRVGTVGEPAAFSLYLHIPYCRSKCPYCDFNSHAATRWPEAAYTRALIAELETYAQTSPWRDGRVQTIFFGGGTPSLFAPESIRTVLQAVARLWPDRGPTVDGSQSSVDDRPCRAAALLSALPTADCRLPTVEITLEANPGTVTLDKLRGLRAAGINRISFGVQSFHPRHLARLGRTHSADDAVSAVRSARAARFDNLNLDLMFAVPGQTLDEWEFDLRTAMGLAPDHISAYNLTFEEGTAFHAMRQRGEIVPQSEDVEAAMFTRTQELLGAAGYEQYEISNYARPSRPCRHNLNYWRAGAYLGVGAGAHSFARAPAPGIRWSNERSPGTYMARVRAAGHARATEDALTDRQAQGEFVFLGLRCREGIDGNEFGRRFGVEFSAAFPHAAAFGRDGLLARDGQRWTLSERGLMVADTIFATFL